MGFGVLTSKASGELSEPTSGEQDQPSFAADLLVGGELQRRIASGAAFLFESGLPAPDHAANQATHTLNLSTAALFGLFVDGYPFAGRGGHLGGAAGMSWARFDPNSTGRSTVQSLGPGGALWFGEDVPLGQHWTLGPLIRLMTERGSDGYDMPWAQSLTLSMTAVYR